MGEWIKSNLGIFILGCIFTLGMSIYGYVDTIKDKRLAEKFNSQMQLLKMEIKERKEADKEIKMIIDNKLDIKQFNEFKTQVDDMKEDIQTIQTDVKEILKKM